MASKVALLATALVGTAFSFPHEILARPKNATARIATSMHPLIPEGVQHAHDRGLAGSNSIGDHAPELQPNASRIPHPVVATAQIACVVAASIGGVAMGLAVCALQKRNRLGQMSAPPVVKCFVCGLLVGIALLVMLPWALEHAVLSHKASYSAQGVLLIFCMAAACMFFIQHTLLGHEHVQERSSNHRNADSCTGCDARAKSSPFAMPRRRMAEGEAEAGEAYCPPCTSNTPASAAILPPAGSTEDQERKAPAGGEVVAEAVAVLLRGLPYTIHAAIDGLMLGTAPSTGMLLQLAVPVLLCAVQDVCTLLISLRAKGASQRTTLLVVACFAVGFPLGVAAALLAVPEDTEALIALRAVAAGVFLYLALFELAPPHVHGRWASCQYTGAFVAGLTAVIASQAAEDALERRMRAS